MLVNESFDGWIGVYGSASVLVVGNSGVGKVEPLEPDGAVSAAVELSDDGAPELATTVDASDTGAAELAGPTEASETGTDDSEAVGADVVAATDASEAPDELAGPTEASETGTDDSEAVGADVVAATDASEAPDELAGPTEASETGTGDSEAAGADVVGATDAFEAPDELAGPTEASETGTDDSEAAGADVVGATDASEAPDELAGPTEASETGSEDSEAGGVDVVATTEASEAAGELAGSAEASVTVGAELEGLADASETGAPELAGPAEVSETGTDDSDTEGAEVVPARDASEIGAPELAGGPGDASDAGATDSDAEGPDVVTAIDASETDAPELAVVCEASDADADDSDAKGAELVAATDASEAPKVLAGSTEASEIGAVDASETDGTGLVGAAGDSEAGADEVGCSTDASEIGAIGDVSEIGAELADIADVSETSAGAPELAEPAVVSETERAELVAAREASEAGAPDDVDGVSDPDGTELVPATETSETGAPELVGAPDVSDAPVAVEGELWDSSVTGDEPPEGGVVASPVTPELTGSALVEAFSGTAVDTSADGELINGWVVGSEAPEIACELSWTLAEVAVVSVAPAETAELKLSETGADGGSVPTEAAGMVISILPATVVPAGAAVSDECRFETSLVPAEWASVAPEAGVTISVASVTFCDTSALADVDSWPAELPIAASVADEPGVVSTTMGLVWDTSGDPDEGEAEGATLSDAGVVELSIMGTEPPVLCGVEPSAPVCVGVAFSVEPIAGAAVVSEASGDTVALEPAVVISGPAVETISEADETGAAVTSTTPETDDAGNPVPVTGSSETTGAELEPAAGPSEAPELLVTAAEVSAAVINFDISLSPRVVTSGTAELPRGAPVVEATENSETGWALVAGASELPPAPAVVEPSGAPELTTGGTEVVEAWLAAIIVLSEIGSVWPDTAPVDVVSAMGTCEFPPVAISDVAELIPAVDSDAPMIGPDVVWPSGEPEVEPAPSETALVVDGCTDGDSDPPAGDDAFSGTWLVAAAEEPTKKVYN